MTSVLVTYATRMGSTAEIALVIGEVLTRAGMVVTVCPCHEARDAADYDAVIIAVPSICDGGMTTRSTTSSARHTPRPTTDVALPEWTVRGRRAERVDRDSPQGGQGDREPRPTAASDVRRPAHPVGSDRADQPLDGDRLTRRRLPRLGSHPRLGGRTSRRSPPRHRPWRQPGAGLAHRSRRLVCQGSFIHRPPR